LLQKGQYLNEMCGNKIGLLSKLRIRKAHVYR